MSMEPQIEGRLDAVEGAKIYGWAWDRSRPGERVAVELRVGDAVLATVTADRERPDLLANGIGDGVHAFEMELDVPPPAGVEAYVRIAGIDAAIPLSRRSEVEIAAESAIAPGLRRLLDALEGMGARQRDLMAGQQALARLIRANPRGEDAAPVNVEQVETLLGQLSDRLEVFETFLMRFDERLHRLEEADAARREEEKTAKRKIFPLKVMGA